MNHFYLNLYFLSCFFLSSQLFAQNIGESLEFGTGQLEKEVIVPSSAKKPPNNTPVSFLLGSEFEKELTPTKLKWVYEIELGQHLEYFLTELEIWSQHEQFQEHKGVLLQISERFKANISLDSLPPLLKNAASQILVHCEKMVDDNAYYMHYSEILIWTELITEYNQLLLSQDEIKTIEWWSIEDSFLQEEKFKAAIVQYENAQYQIDFLRKENLQNANGANNQEAFILAFSNQYKALGKIIREYNTLKKWERLSNSEILPSDNKSQRIEKNDQKIKYQGIEKRLKEVNISLKQKVSNSRQYLQKQFKKPQPLKLKSAQFLEGNKILIDWLNPTDAKRSEIIISRETNNDIFLEKIPRDRSSLTTSLEYKNQKLKSISIYAGNHFGAQSNSIYIPIQLENMSHNIISPIVNPFSAGFYKYYDKIYIAKNIQHPIQNYKILAKNNKERKVEFNRFLTLPGKENTVLSTDPQYFNKTIINSIKPAHIHLVQFAQSGIAWLNNKDKKEFLKQLNVEVPEIAKEKSFKQLKNQGKLIVQPSDHFLIEGFKNDDYLKTPFMKYWIYSLALFEKEFSNLNSAEYKNKMEIYKNRLNSLTKAFWIIQCQLNQYLQKETSFEAMKPLIALAWSNHQPLYYQKAIWEWGKDLSDPEFQKYKKQFQSFKLDQRFANAKIKEKDIFEKLNLYSYLQKDSEHLYAKNIINEEVLLNASKSLNAQQMNTLNEWIKKRVGWKSYLSKLNYQWRPIDEKLGGHLQFIILISFAIITILFGYLVARKI